MNDTRQRRGRKSKDGFECCLAIGSVPKSKTLNFLAKWFPLTTIRKGQHGLKTTLN